MRRALYALAAYSAIAVAMTWPLARGLARDVAWDLGDSVLNMWILAWDCEQFRAILSGHLTHAGTFFDANIFHPAPLALAYSEHLIPQALQILPVYWLTGNPILSYNLLYLSTFALSGLGMYLFLREVTGNAHAALVGGLLFAFAPYRIPQSSHLQVLSSQWMPFALYGIRRYVQHGRRRALAGAAAAVVAQNLSCGYYLLYFPPFVGAYALWEAWRGGRWNTRTLIDFSVTAVAVVVVTAPFVLPYLQVREELQLARSVTETSRLSADVYSYFTASQAQAWGSRLANVYPKPEGELFPGLVTIVLAVVGLLWGDPRPRHPDVSSPLGEMSRGRRWLVWGASGVAVGHAVAVIAAVLLRRVTLHVLVFDISLGNVTQLLLRAAVAFALVLWLSPTARHRAGRFFWSRGFYAAALGAAVWLSLGPVPRVMGRPLDLASPYRLLWDAVPGFDGLRVPARFAMIATLMLAILGGYGAATILRRKAGTTLAVLLVAAFLFESAARPFVVNAMEPLREFTTPEARLYPPNRAPTIYRAVARLPSDAVLAELPIGQTDYDVRAMYYSIVHWRRLVNGYSGYFPLYYRRIAFSLSQVPLHPVVSLDALGEVGATHVIVHEGAYVDSEGRDTTAALRRLGARELFRESGDVLLALPMRTRDPQR